MDTLPTLPSALSTEQLRSLNDEHTLTFSFRDEPTLSTQGLSATPLTNHLRVVPGNTTATSSTALNDRGVFTVAEEHNTIPRWNGTLYRQGKKTGAQLPSFEHPETLAPSQYFLLYPQIARTRNPLSLPKRFPTPAFSWLRHVLLLLTTRRRYYVGYSISFGHPASHLYAQPPSQEGSHELQLHPQLLSSPRRPVPDIMPLRPRGGRPLGVP
ncbi:hypothetical protein BJ875DRAFT_458442 [Amylocarpus encephaloides]|uniref:Uncharacterized protein n=1 Tax=Amylocarpus encephaloides TaxID=45428 RepID=A0A9P7YM96_9HELO|nr:hypothetical protein BJ875DRAFT_458442 [Amylocarpus encephaloides]